jgi:predicted pyridoxine 5'-phosphate oxidase superfamily flavin-nucleotide-binding protein
MKTSYQEEFGYSLERTAGKVKSEMAPSIQEFISKSPFCVLATRNANGDCDASPKGDKPGLVEVLNDEQLSSPMWRETNSFIATETLRVIPKRG